MTAPADARSRPRAGSGAAVRISSFATGVLGAALVAFAWSPWLHVSGQAESLAELQSRGGSELRAMAGVLLGGLLAVVGGAWAAFGAARTRTVAWCVGASALAALVALSALWASSIARFLDGYEGWSGSELGTGWVGAVSASLVAVAVVAVGAGATVATTRWRRPTGGRLAGAVAAVVGAVVAVWALAEGGIFPVAYALHRDLFEPAPTPTMALAGASIGVLMVVGAAVAVLARGTVTGVGVAAGWAAFTGVLIAQLEAGLAVAGADAPGWSRVGEVLALALAVVLVLQAVRVAEAGQPGGR